MGKNAPADPDKPNDVGVHDELGEDIKKAQAEALRKEVVLYDGNLKKVREARDNYVPQWEVEKRIWELRLENENYKKLTPDFGYQAVPEYWDLMKKLMEWKFREESFIAEDRIKGFTTQEEMFSKMREQAVNKLKEMGEDV